MSSSSFTYVARRVEKKIATTTADADGEFAFTAAQTGQSGRFLIFVEKGAFNGGVTDPIDVEGGTSTFQIVFLEQ